MYDLGEQFKFDINKSMPNPESVFKGSKYRITVLTERLVRLEYNENGFFEDYPTEVVWYRNLPKPEFTVSETDSVIRIITKYFELTYKKECKFDSGKFNPTANLKISLLNSDKVWYYGHPEARNYGTNSYTIDDKKFVKGLYSLDGFATIDDSKTSLILGNGNFKRRDNEGIDLYVFLYNKDFYHCLNDYFAITGNPPLIPRYALGNWWCKSDLYNEYDLAMIINNFEKKNVPISIFMMDKWNIPDSYEFNEYYKEPKKITNFLDSKKIKLGLVIDDPISFKANTRNYEKVKTYLNEDESGKIPFNLFDSRTIDTYLKLIIHPLNDMGNDLFFLNNFTKNNDERNFILKHYLFYDRFNNSNKRALICSYNSLKAPHRYPVLYAGKSVVGWDTLKKIPNFNILASNMGISFLSHDLGGTIDGIEDSELFIRFVQLGVFSPILRLGADSGKYYKREPWKWDLSTSVIVNKFLNIRYKLIPYIYTEAYKYHKYGKPLIDPLYHKYPNLYDDDVFSNQYFFGSNILVSPILNKKNELMNRVIQKIYIPEGIWYDIFTGKKYNGGRKYTAFYKDEEYPLFVRAGAIIPFSLNKFNDTKVPDALEIVIFPGANNTYSIYEDDGITNNYKNGDHLITNVEYIYEKNNYKVTIMPVSGKVGIAPSNRTYKVLFRNTNLPSKVMSYIGSTQVNNKCYQDESDLIVEVNDVPTNSQLTIVCSGDNLEIDALHIINEDIVSIISELPIKTIVKQKIDDIMFSKQYTINKKRIEIRKLANGKNWIERKYVDLFLKLLEYIKEV